jgi:hypothetical protein
VPRPRCGFGQIRGSRVIQPGDGFADFNTRTATPGGCGLRNYNLADYMATRHTIYDTGIVGHIGTYDDAVDMEAPAARWKADFRKDGLLP